MAKVDNRGNAPAHLDATAVVALALLLGASIILFVWTECRLQKIVETFNHPMPGKALAPDPFTGVVPRMEKQKEQYGSWAYTALAAIVAISVVKRVLPSPWIRWAYVILGPAAVLLLQTIRAGVYFDQRLTYLSLRGVMNPMQFGGIQRLLGLQVKYLSLGLSLLLVFVGSFVVAIVLGKLHVNSDIEED